LKENDVTGTRDSNGRDNYNKKIQNFKKGYFESQGVDGSIILK
jgi:hypothetical protein